MAPTMWHGSPDRFAGSFERKSVMSRMHAHWASCNPVAAALYAGDDGWVMPVNLAPGAAMLRADGWPGEVPLNYLSDDETDRMTAIYGEHGLDEGNESLPPGDAGRVFSVAFRRLRLPTSMAMPCWEGIIDETDVDCETINPILQAAGFDAVFCREGTKAMMGDFRFHGLEDMLGDSLRARVARKLSFGTSVPSVAFLESHAAVVDVSRAVPARTILQAALDGRAPPAATVASMAARCSKASFPGRTRQPTGP